MKFTKIKEIDTIDYVIHPTYLHYDKPEETTKLLIRLTNYFAHYSNDKKRLTILDFGSNAENENFNREFLIPEFKGFSQYKQQINKKDMMNQFLIKNCEKYCPENFIRIDDKKDDKYLNNKIFKKFNIGHSNLPTSILEYISSERFRFNKEGINIIGHGTIRDSCVIQNLYFLKDTIDSMYKSKNNAIIKEINCINLE